jgi:hypothetical protein
LASQMRSPNAEASNRRQHAAPTSPGPETSPKDSAALPPLSREFLAHLYYAHPPISAELIREIWDEHLELPELWTEWIHECTLCLAAGHRPSLQPRAEWSAAGDDAFETFLDDLEAKREAFADQDPASSAKPPFVRILLELKKRRILGVLKDLKHRATDLSFRQGVEGAQLLQPLSIALMQATRDLERIDAELRGGLTSVPDESKK